MVFSRNGYLTEANQSKSLESKLFIFVYMAVALVAMVKRVKFVRVCESNATERRCVLCQTCKSACSDSQYACKDFY